MDDLELGKVDNFQTAWRKLTPVQKRFAVAMLDYPTKKEAAEAIGISPQTAYNWNGAVDTVVELMAENAALSALSIVLANTNKAAMVKAAGLDSDNEKIAQDAASEILDRALGKATQRNEVTGKDGEPLRVKFIDYGLDDSSTD